MDRTERFKYSFRRRGWKRRENNGGKENELTVTNTVCQALCGTRTDFFSPETDTIVAFHRGEF